MNIKDRFLEYVSIDTKSDPHSTSVPSASNVFDLANLLVKQLKEFNVEDVELVKEGIVYGVIPSNGGKGDVIGFIAHMDTAPDFPGNDIKPNVIDNYDGSVIKLANGLEIDPEEFTNLKLMINHQLITTDGTTLLGADDKAGVAIIMNMVQYLSEHPEIKHNDIKIAFTPDEEIGHGADNFDVKKFNADYAFTLDGDIVQEYSYESFNAYSVIVDIKGKSIHPGSAKNKMVNASSVGLTFDSMLPTNMRPEYTDGYDGFNHLHSISGDCDHCKLEYIVRNHDDEIIQKQLNDFKRIKDYLDDKYGYEIITLTITEQYRNMASIVSKHPAIINKLERAISSVGLKPISNPIRGGTDGCRLTYMGLPTPNIGTGGGNYHGPLEYVSLTQMELATQVIINLVKE